MGWPQGIKVVQYRIGFLSGKYTHRVDKYKSGLTIVIKYKNTGLASLMTIANGSIT